MHIKGCDLFIAFFCLVTDQMNGRVSNCRNFNGTNPPFLGGFLSVQFKALIPHLLQGQVYKTILRWHVGYSEEILRFLLNRRLLFYRVLF